MHNFGQLLHEAQLRRLALIEANKHQVKPQSNTDRVLDLLNTSRNVYAGIVKNG